MVRLENFNIFIITTPEYYAEQDLLKLSKNRTAQVSTGGEMLFKKLRPDMYVCMYTGMFPGGGGRMAQTLMGTQSPMGTIVFILPGGVSIHSQPPLVYAPVHSHLPNLLMMLNCDH